MRRIGIGLTAALFFAAVAAPALASKPATPNEGLVGDHKVTICHATSSSNPVQYWEVITVDIASSGGRAKLQGHLEHIEKAKKDDRTDVIPPFTYPGHPPFLGAGNPNQVGLPLACQGTASAELTVTKVVVGGTLVVADFALYVDATQVISGEKNIFAPDTYIVSESPKDGYYPEFTGDCDSDGTITLVANDVKACTITNTYRVG